MQDELYVGEQLAFEKCERVSRHTYHPTEEQFERTDLQILAYRNLLDSAHAAGWSETWSQ